MDTLRQTACAKGALECLASEAHSIDPRHEPSHAPLVSGIFGKLLPQPAFFYPGLGIKERAQGERSHECGPASPNQRPANRTTEYRRVKRMAHQPIDARLDQFGACERFGKRRQVSPQAYCARQTAADGDHEQERSAKGEGKTLPLIVIENAPGNNCAQKRALSQHPKPAALQKVAAHVCSIARKVNSRRTITRPAVFLKEQESTSTAAPAWLRLSPEWQLCQPQLSYQRGKTIPNSSSAPSALRRMRLRWTRAPLAASRPRS